LSSRIGREPQAISIREVCEEIEQLFWKRALLAIGYFHTPRGLDWDSHYDVHPGISVWEFTTSGNATVDREFFGLLVQLDDDDPLSVLARSYYGSQLPGYERIDYNTSFYDVLELSKRLQGVGLSIDQNKFADFSEGYLPISVESAWEHVQAKDLRVLAGDFDRCHARPLRGLGLESVAEAEAYLDVAWSYVSSQTCPGELSFHEMASAGAISENSD